MKKGLLFGLVTLTGVVLMSFVVATRRTRAWHYREDVQDEIDLYRMRGGRGR